MRIAMACAGPSLPSTVSRSAKLSCAMSLLWHVARRTERRTGMPGALDGLLVVSLEQAVAAPYCSSRLADAGARVIKIERPEGDFARFYDKAAKGLSTYFVWLNRGKQSLVADIKDPADAALLHRILARADVF